MISDQRSVITEGTSLNRFSKMNNTQTSSNQPSIFQRNYIFKFEVRYKIVSSVFSLWVDKVETFRLNPLKCILYIE